MKFAKHHSLTKISYKDIANSIGVAHPYSVRQAIDNMIRDGQLLRNEKSGEIFLPGSENGTRLLSVPILGYVSCGPATATAEVSPLEFLEVSPSVANIKKPKDTFALIASGESMNKSSINNKDVQNGDYVIVEKQPLGEVRDKSYVVSRFYDTFNLKRITIDKANERIVLLSESSESTTPIIIAAEDIEYFEIEGVAVDVVKGI